MTGRKNIRRRRTRAEREFVSRAEEALEPMPGEATDLAGTLREVTGAVVANAQALKREVERFQIR